MKGGERKYGINCVVLVVVVVIVVAVVVGGGGGGGGGGGSGGGNSGVEKETQLMPYFLSPPFISCHFPFFFLYSLHLPPIYPFASYPGSKKTQPMRLNNTRHDPPSPILLVERSGEWFNESPNHIL